jgi:hypothetical protein
MHRVEQAVRREVRMEGEADEAALEPVIDGQRECLLTFAYTCGGLLPLMM